MSASRHHRSASRTGAVLVLLLATLLHVLACAHGPTLAGEARADTPFVAAAACGQAPHDQQQAGTGQSSPYHDRGAHCWGGDEPTVQPPRDVTSALSVVHDALPGGHTVVLVPPSRPSPAPPVSGGPSAGHARALFGVWRT
ncbi:hypothetical protein AB0M00_09320 [Streptomyces chartreusis]|uniref:hypothetical protein n=1 Tax=Streptomyces chartreusis TaxID=1969 RepID=UPI003427C64D